MIIHDTPLTPGEGETDPDSGKTLTVKEMDSDLQPREKALKLGLGVLSVPELLALILRTGLPGKPITLICRELMNANGGSLHTLERRQRAELLAVKGLGRTKVIQIEAVMELIRRYNIEEPGDNPKIASSTDIYNVMRPRIGNLDHEEIWMLFMTHSNRVTRLYRVSSGGTAATIFDVKMILKAALAENTAAMAMCHNHPSGNLIPSQQDDAITRKCANACRLLDINFLDHVIVTANGFYSYSDSGRIP